MAFDANPKLQTCLAMFCLLLLIFVGVPYASCASAALDAGQMPAMHCDGCCPAVASVGCCTLDGGKGVALRSVVRANLAEATRASSPCAWCVPSLSAGVYAAARTTSSPLLHPILRL